MTDTRPSKRARNDASPQRLGEESTTGYKHSDAFWLRDGNVVLVAEKVAFRVHQSVLERKSVVFKDMFGVPQPENAERMEECPLVHVSDAAEDITHLLSVLYDGDRFLNMDSPISMRMVFALLQLGIKYQIDYLRDEAISVLKIVYRPTYAKYIGLKRSNNALRVTERRLTEDSIVVINLAWKHGLSSLLPGAFYVCALLPYRTLADATVRVLEKDDLTKLSSDDLVRCLNGRQALQSKFLRRFKFLSKTTACSDCLKPHECPESLQDRKDEDLWEHVSNIIDGDFDPLEEFDWMQWLHVCDECRMHFDEVDGVARKNMYDGLPGTFNLVSFMIEHPGP
ncbi:hypothetical protein EIP91_005090 [Steccherinum ochraceum]|uniref:BTB domain-containing protein n=1 Tax=Steccherinum ochraceum TaxID=92696 RepID=A0A4R0RDT0_9APHY|nr:hypothetical protein EIP91_005090 [Steccherinum ochraceum]